MTVVSINKVTLCPRCKDEHSLQTLCVADSKSCPNCGHFGPIDTDFGLRMRESGKLRAQSHCRTCRGGKTPKAVAPPKRQSVARGFTKTGSPTPRANTQSQPSVTKSCLVSTMTTITASETGAMYSRERLKEKYQANYPGDKCTTRSFGFMAKKLGKKFNTVITELPTP